MEASLARRTAFIKMEQLGRHVDYYYAYLLTDDEYRAAVDALLTEREQARKGETK